MKAIIKNPLLYFSYSLMFAFDQNSEAQFLKKLQNNAKKNTKQVAPQQKEVTSTDNEVATKEEVPVKALKPWSKFNFVKA